VKAKRIAVTCKSVCLWLQSRPARQKRPASWEGRRRAGRGALATVAVQGWGRQQTAAPQHEHHQATILDIMPGSSLWLLPPSESLDTVLSCLIEQTSLHFHSTHTFLPHVTLTSEVLPAKYSSDPQAWLDSLNLHSRDEVHVKFKELASEDIFFRKLCKCTCTLHAVYVRQILTSYLHFSKTSSASRRMVSRS